MPSLHLSGFDQRKYFSAHALARSRSYSTGEDVLWLLSTAATLTALAVLTWRLPRSIRQIGLGAVGSAVIAGMVLLVTLWFVSLPFSFVDLWWQHHWGLGPFDVAAWLGSQWSTLGPEAVSAMATIVLLVGLAHRFRLWWLIAWPVIVGIALFFAFVSGWLSAAGARPLASPLLRSDVVRLERVEHVTGTPVRVQDVSSWTSQANAFTVGFGPADACRGLEHAARRSLLPRRDRRRGGSRARSRAQPSRPEGARLDGPARAPDAVARRARHEAARRRRRPGKPSAGHPDACRAGAADDSDSERRLAALRGRGGLARSERDPRSRPRPESSSRASSRRASRIRAHRSGTTCGSRTTRR